MTEKRFVIDDDGIVTDMTDLSTYIDEEDCCEKLNELNDENKELKAEIIKWKSKYFDAMDTVINEYSTNIKEDMEKLEKEVWGDVE